MEQKITPVKTEEVDYIAMAIQSYNVTDAALAKYKQDSLAIKVMGYDDKENCSKARNLRIVCKNTRVLVEKKRKELKSDSLRFGQAVDAEARRISQSLEGNESYLQSQEDIVAKHQEKLEAEARIIAEAKRLEEESKKEEQRQKELQAMEAERQRIEKERVEIEIAKRELTAEKERVANEKHRLEQDRKFEEAKRIAKIEAEQREKLKAIEDEKKRIVDTQLAKDRAIEASKQIAIEIEQAKKKAIEETEKRLKMAAEESLRKIQAIAEAKRKKEARAPDKEKLANLLNTFNTIVLPLVTSPEAKQIILAVTEDLKGIQHYLLVNIEKL